MKKKLFAALSAFVFIFSFVSVASAASVPAGMEKAIEKGLKAEHYDLKKGSITFDNVQTVSNEDKELKTDQVVVAVAHYKTVRDNIFVTSHTDIVAYNPAKKLMLTDQETAKIGSEFKSYVKAHEDQKGEHRDSVVICLLLALILIVPILLMTVWEKRQYLSTEWKIKNNVYNQSKSFN
ncbi:hypothetical protein WD019_03815 [Fictibacillus sp. Mic-4]|uniref:hypothetical protein n=1 Tax=Fictibacillus TaxID=1329200 RepID=UPI00042757C0|nr:hypothetical protein [Fictibacillus gelatini]